MWSVVQWPAHRTNWELLLEVLIYVLTNDIVPQFLGYHAVSSGSSDPTCQLLLPAHLWWTRFLVVGHCLFRGARHEQLCATAHTDRFLSFAAFSQEGSNHLSWWLRSTIITQRTKFFRNPNVMTLVRHVRNSSRFHAMRDLYALHASRTNHPWLFGPWGMLQSLVRMHHTIKGVHPIVL